MKLIEIYRELLIERTFDINEDVQFVYEYGGFKDFIEEYSLGETKPHYDKISRGIEVVFNTFGSDKLTSDESKKAHIINPVSITTGILRRNGNSYNVHTHEVRCSISYGALDFLYTDSGTWQLSQQQQKSIKNEMTEFRIKASIQHELSHWISDSLHNGRVARALARANKIIDGGGDISTAWEYGDVNFTDMEIDAQVHGIKSVKSVISDRWDVITVEDLFSIYPPLSLIHSKLKRIGGLKLSHKWQRALLTRMHRENLIGSKMKNFVSS